LIRKNTMNLKRIAFAIIPLILILVCAEHAHAFGRKRRTPANPQPTPSAIASRPSPAPVPAPTSGPNPNPSASPAPAPRAPQNPTLPGGEELSTQQVRVQRVDWDGYIRPQISTLADLAQGHPIVLLPWELTQPESELALSEALTSVRARSGRVRLVVAIVAEYPIHWPTRVRELLSRLGRQKNEAQVVIHDPSTIRKNGAEGVPMTRAFGSHGLQVATFPGISELSSAYQDWLFEFAANGRSEFNISDPRWGDPSLGRAWALECTKAIQQAISRGRISSAEFAAASDQLHPWSDWMAYIESTGLPPLSDRLDPEVVSDLVARLEAVDTSEWSDELVTAGEKRWMKKIIVREGDMMMVEWNDDRYLLFRYADVKMGIPDFLMEGVYFDRYDEWYRAKKMVRLPPINPETNQRYPIPILRPIAGRDCMLPEKYWRD
jgi:hypothetical protein